MKSVRLLMVVGLMCSLFAQAEEVHFFKGTYEEAMQQAKNQNKLIFIDFRAAWCKPCVEMERTTFKDSAVANLINTYFIPFMADVDFFAGMDVKERYNVNQYPTLLVVNQYDEVQIRMIGFKPASILQLELKEILAMNEVVILEETADDVFQTDQQIETTEDLPVEKDEEKKCRLKNIFKKD